jgi:solute:Na+ symporter, SSS family
MNGPGDAQMRMLVIGIYLVALVLVGGAASLFSRGTRKDYLLASHTVGPVLLLLCLFGTTMTAFAMVGSSGEAYKKGIGIYGLMASSSGIVHSLCVFLIGTRLWAFGQRYGYTTQIQFFRDRLESPLIGWVLFPVLVGLVVPYLLVGVIGAGASILAMTAGAYPNWPLFDHVNPALDGGVPTWLGTLVVCLVVLAYVFLGGMRGTTWANAGQTLLFVVLGIVAFVMLAARIGGEDNLLANMQAAIRDVDPELLSRERMSRYSFLAYLLIPLSMGMFPHLFQHWLTARSAKAFRLSIILHPVFILLVWLPCVFIGIWASAVDLPAAIQSDPNKVLPYLVKSQLSPLVSGLVTAGILAAIMSSLDSQVLCVGTMFASDVVSGRGERRRFSDGAEIWIARVFVVLVMAVTWWLSWMLAGNRSVFALGIWCFAGFAGLFPLVFTALYWRGLTAAGALSSVLAMAGSWGYLFWRSDWGANQEFTVPVRVGGQLVGLEPVVLILTASTLALLVTSLVTSRPAAATIARFFPVR